MLHGSLPFPSGMVAGKVVMGKVRGQVSGVTGSLEKGPVLDWLFPLSTWGQHGYGGQVATLHLFWPPGSSLLNINYCVPHQDYPELAINSF